MQKLTKKQRLKIIKENIEWYKVGSPVAKAMIHFGELGFSFCGHGCGFGGEDFGLIRKDLYVNFCIRGTTCVVSINTSPQEDDSEVATLFEGSIREATKFMKDNEELLKQRVAY